MSTAAAIIAVVLGLLILAAVAVIAERRPGG